MTHDTPPKRITLEEAQAAVDPRLVAEILRDFGTNFDGVYPVGVLARGVGPEQSMIGLAIKRGHLVTRSHADAMVAAALRVKPLEWKEYPSFWRADTAIGEYSVGFDDGWWAQLEGVEFWDWQPEEDPRSYSGPNAGMLACKADYEARICAVLTTGENDD